MSDSRLTRTQAQSALPAPRPAGRRWWLPGAVAVMCIALACAVASQVDVGYYVITPGVAQPVGPLIRVPHPRAAKARGTILLTDVFVTGVNALTYLYDRFRPDAQLLPASTVLGTATPPSQLVAQGYLEMHQSQLSAKAAALRELGHDVRARGVGALVFAVLAGSPAARVLRVGETITAVDTHPTPDACALSSALSGTRPGEVVSLVLRRSKVTSLATLVEGPTAVEHVRLTRWPSDVPQPVRNASCPGAAPQGQGFLGVEAETEEHYRFPLPIEISTTSIGGPSAGLALSLGIVDALDGGFSTGGRTVSATGTISATGDVGAVGGVPQKTVAVSRAGATVFFVPATQVATAKGRATHHLAIYGVRTLSQALGILRRLAAPHRRSGARRVTRCALSPVAARCGS